MNPTHNLYSYFLKIKREIFGNSKFVVIDKEIEQTPSQQKYNILFQYFYPSFRTIPESTLLKQVVEIESQL